MQPIKGCKESSNITETLLIYTKECEVTIWIKIYKASFFQNPLIEWHVLSIKDYMLFVDNWPEMSQLCECHHPHLHLMVMLGLCLCNFQCTVVAKCTDCNKTSCHVICILHKTYLNFQLFPDIKQPLSVLQEEKFVLMVVALSHVNRVRVFLCLQAKHNTRQPHFYWC